MMSPQTNSAFQHDDENEYQVHLNKPRKQADCFKIFNPGDFKFSPKNYKSDMSYFGIQS